MVETITCTGTGILAPALTIGLVVPSRKSSEVVHQHQETDHVRALFLQRRWEGSVRDRFRTLKAMRRSWKRRTWRRWSTFRRLGGGPFCLFLERGIFYSVGSYLSCGYNTSRRLFRIQEGTESNGYRGTGPGERVGSVNERSSHHRVVSGQLHDAQTPANRPLPHV